jgi:CubicO group peptidase (beta-lactamase class C family)
LEREALDADAVADQLVTDHVATAVSAGVACRAGVPPHRAWRSEIGGASSTFFDLASLTKPMTAVAVARAKIERTAELASLLPELAGTASAKVTIEHLLSHRAGLEAHVPLYRPVLRGDPFDTAAALREAANARRADAQGPIPVDGFTPLYSDLGFILAGEALARAVGARDAGEAIERLVVEPLGAGTQLGTARELEARGVDLMLLAAPTEDVDWRGGVVRARVHDENAWALAGDGGAGHAGMFGQARAVLAFGCAVFEGLVGQSGPLGVSGGLRWLMAPRPGGTLRAGFDGKAPEGSSAGTVAGPRTFGHLGFTGTSLWIDPDAAAVTVLLTNRVHPTRENTAIRAARPRAHDALFARARVLGAKVAG